MALTVLPQNRKMTAHRSLRVHELTTSSSPRASIAIVATGRSSLTMMTRTTSAGYASVSIFEHSERALEEAQRGRISAVLALLEPQLLSREQLHQFDLLGIGVGGVIAHARHQSWSELLPLMETVWLFAPGLYYRKLIQGLPSKTHPVLRQ